MPREVGVALFVVLGVGLLLLMVLSWRARKHRQARIGTPAVVPADLGQIAGAFDGLYVATTLSEQALQRIAVEPLGFRADATITVSETGLAVALTGSDPWFIPVADLTGHRRASWTIDRGVEEDGLNLVSWTLAGKDGSTTGLDSYFRLREPQAFQQAMASLAASMTLSSEGTTA